MKSQFSNNIDLTNAPEGKSDLNLPQFTLDEGKDWYKLYYSKIEPNTEKDHVFGCIFGGFIGDAAGAYLEFMKTLPVKEQVEAAMCMPGGGILNIGPGQGTDDTEMQMAILSALYETNHG